MKYDKGEVIEREGREQDTSYLAKEDDKEVENKPYYFINIQNLYITIRWEDTDVYVNGDCLNEIYAHLFR